MDNLTDYYIKKYAFFPLAPILVGAGIGALGGALTAPKGHRLAGALTGTAWGAIPGGAIGGVGKALWRGAGRAGAKAAFGKALAGTTSKQMAGTALRDVGIGSMIMGATGAYNQPQSQFGQSQQYNY